MGRTWHFPTILTQNTWVYFVSNSMLGKECSASSPIRQQSPSPRVIKVTHLWLVWNKNHELWLFLWKICHVSVETGFYHSESYCNNCRLFYTHSSLKKQSDFYILVHMQLWLNCENIECWEERNMAGSGKKYQAYRICAGIPFPPWSC